MNSAYSEDLLDVLHAAVLFELIQILRRLDERYLAEMPGAFVPETGDLLARADAAADSRLLRGGIIGGGKLFCALWGKQTHDKNSFLLLRRLFS